MLGTRDKRLHCPSNRHPFPGNAFSELSQLPVAVGAGGTSLEMTHAFLIRDDLTFDDTESLKIQTFVSSSLIWITCRVSSRVFALIGRMCKRFTC